MNKGLKLLAPAPFEPNHNQQEGLVNTAPMALVGSGPFH
jgi:hypothetical protein